MSPRSDFVAISGRVVPGRGNASGHISSNAESLAAITGGPLFPGSLNLVLHRPLVLSQVHGHIFDRERIVWPAKIGDREVWLYRWSTAPDTVIEVLATERLRDTLALQDNAAVSITLPATFVLQPKSLDYARWLLFWYGRADWYYRYNRYMRAVLRLEQQFSWLGSLFKRHR